MVAAWILLDTGIGLESWTRQILADRSMEGEDCRGNLNSTGRGQLGSHQAVARTRCEPVNGMA